MNANAPLCIPTIADVKAARTRIAAYIRRTPILEHALLNERVGGRILLKAECLQITGSFKFRGAMNRLLQLEGEAKDRGVVAFSSGNHAQAIAYAARMLGMPAVIIMPKDAPAMKIANTRAYGAEVVLYDRLKDDREAMGRAYVAARGMTLVPPFEDPDIIAGQGSIGLEVAEDCPVRPDAVLACCSGGGMLTGLALAIKDAWPDLPVYAVEPQGYDDFAQSLRDGQRVAIKPGTPSLADSLLSPTPGAIAFELAKRLIDGGFQVSDNEMKSAMADAFAYFKVVLEPGGAAPLAAALSGKIETKGKTLLVIGSGGNVDANLFAAAIEGR